MLFRVFAFSFSLFSLASCVPVAIVGVGGGVGAYATRNETGVGGKISDVEIGLKVDKKLFEYDSKMKGDINFVVKNACVLLVGSVPDGEDRHAIEEIISRTDGVKLVFNELKINEKYSNAESLSDTLMTSDINARLLMNKCIKSLNYKIISYKNNVYIIGISETEQELNQVIATIKKVVGVKKIISYITLKK